MLGACCRGGKCLNTSRLYQAGPSSFSRACLTTSSPAQNGKPLPVTDWSKPAGSSSSGSRPPRNDRGPRPPRPPPRDGERPSGRRPMPSFGMMPRGGQKSNGPRTPSARSGTQDKPDGGDLASNLQKWNLSAAPAKRNTQEGDEKAPTRRLSMSERFDNEEEPELDTRHGRRLKPGEKGLSRSFDAVKKASGGGDFSLDRGHGRQGSKKGKEREFDSNRNSRLDLARKADKPRRMQKAKETEKEVYVPSTVTVSRLADIFGVKICES